MRAVRHWGSTCPFPFFLPGKRRDPSLTSGGQLQLPWELLTLASLVSGAAISAPRRTGHAPPKAFPRKNLVAQVVHRRGFLRPPSSWSWVKLRNVPRMSGSPGSVVSGAGSATALPSGWQLTGGQDSPLMQVSSSARPSSRPWCLTGFRSFSGVSKTLHDIHR